MSTPRQTSLLVGVAAVALLFGATGGAVAGGVVTGKQIKNSSVTGKDIKNRSLGTADLSASALSTLHGAAGAPGAPGSPGSPGVSGTPGVSGYVLTGHLQNVAAGTPTTMDVDCPGAKKLVGAAAYWSTANDAVQVLFKDDNTASAYTAGVPAADALILQVVCVTAPAARPTTRGFGKTGR